MQRQPLNPMLLPPLLFQPEGAVCFSALQQAEAPRCQEGQDLCSADRRPLTPKGYIWNSGCSGPAQADVLQHRRSSDPKASDSQVQGTRQVRKYSVALCYSKTCFNARL